MRQEELSTRDWGERYARVRPHYEVLTEELARLLRNILEHEEVEPAQLEARAKEVTSFTDKVERKDGKYEDPLAQVTDLAGLRVIVYYIADVTRVGEIIEREFTVDWENSLRQGADTDPDRFGYRSDHYVVSLTPQRAALAEWQQFSQYKAEIQVRTVMQHAWAAVDHKIRYKRGSLPRDLQRRLSRLSALLEVADEQFASVHRASTDLQAAYAASVARGNFAVALDALSLQAYLEESGLLERWEERALSAGFAPSDLVRDSEFVDRRRQDLLMAFANTGVRDLADVDTLYKGAESWGSDALRAIVSATRDGATELQAIPEDVLELLALYAGGKARAIDASRFSTEIKAGMRTALKRAPASRS